MPARLRFGLLAPVVGIAALALVVFSAHLRAEEAAAVPDFCFLQVTDMHISPQPVGVPDPRPTDRSVDALAWFCREAKKPHVLEPVGITTAVPAFTIATGDLTEYGVIHKTWTNFEGFLEPLGMPLYATPGNHDNTWTAMQHIMRRRRGGDHYSFEKFGCHFASINTATPQEPVPSIEQRTLTWLRSDLKSVPKDRPVFLFCHHPLSSGEFAKPFEQLRLLELIAEHNVVLLLMGHGHGVRHERWGTLDSVMGGTTFGKNVGYNIVSVIDGVLRVVYRYRDADRPMKVLLDKPVAPPETPDMTIYKPVGESTQGQATPVVSGKTMPLGVRITGASPVKVTAALDGDEDGRQQLLPVKQDRDRETWMFEGAVSTSGLVPGLHFVSVTADFDALQLDRAREVIYAPGESSVRPSRVELPSGMKSQPVLAGNDVLVSTTAGRIIRVAFGPGRGRTDPLFDAGVEILHAPVAAGDTLYFSAAEKGVHSIGLDGKLNWRCDVGAVVYGTPALDDDRVYVGDLEGFVHAIDRKTGKLIFSKRHALYSIEQSVVLRGGVVYFGAWDGYVYAVDAGDGSLKWKQRGPAGHRSETKYRSRYYGPADCSPVLIGDRVFVTDRAYCLGSYSLSGEYLGEIASDIAAIGPSADGKSFYARGRKSEGLTRYGAAGRQMWSSAVRLGRFPIPPTEVSGKVYVCSNRGLLTVHGAADGKVLWQYQVTPQLHVMAPVAADADGNAYVAGMDGTVTRVAQRK